MSVDFEAIERFLRTAADEARSHLYEHEVYQIVQASGAVVVPKTIFVRAGEELSTEALDRMPGEKAVLKIVSPSLTHKSDVGGVVFVEHTLEAVRIGIADMLDRCRSKSIEATGVLVCQYFAYGGTWGFGNELFVGIRASREFGPVISAGIGGVHTEYFASQLRKGASIAIGLAMETTGRAFFEQFKGTVAYDILSGKARGYSRLVADEGLIECFEAFIQMARRFASPDRGEKPAITELEVNPFAFLHGYMVPLDGVAFIGTLSPAPPKRPIQKIDRLLHPKSMAILGASSKGMNMGRVILNNVLDFGFDRSRVYVVKAGLDELDGVKCFDSIGSLPERVDLTVLCVGAAAIPSLVDEIIERRSSESVIVIPGGMGETEDSKHVEQAVRRKIIEAHGAEDGGPVFLGGNCLGIQSRPGRYDTMFIPPEKLAKRRGAEGRRTALISQSGAYVITRMSNLQTLDPNYAISVGNQIDLTISDLLEFLDQAGTIDVFGVYVEGFRDLDGLAFSRAVRRAVSRGKDVIFYKAGRTTAGQQATATHTASIAGDYNVCEAAVSSAGGLMCETFKGFEQLMELATYLHGCQIRGTRIGAISNAGYETVGMADAIKGPGYEARLPQFDERFQARLEEILKKHKLEGLVTPRNPLDLTPMANDEAHEACIRAFLDHPDIDAVVTSFVPLTPAMKTTPEEIADKSSMPNRIPRLAAATDKPLVVVVDSGSLYDPLATRIRESGIPVFRSADSAVRTLGRYICHKWRLRNT